MAKIYKPINISTGAGGGSTPPYNQAFLVGSWSGPSGGNYTISITEATHGQGINTLVQVYELVGADYELIDIAVHADATGNITLLVNEIPDLRFEGKVVIKGE